MDNSSSNRGKAVGEESEENGGESTPYAHFLTEDVKEFKGEQVWKQSEAEAIERKRAREAIRVMKCTRH